MAEVLLEKWLQNKYIFLIITFLWLLVEVHIMSCSGLKFGGVVVGGHPVVRMTPPPCNPASVAGLGQAVEAMGGMGSCRTLAAAAAAAAAAVMGAATAG